MKRIPVLMTVAALILGLTACTKEIPVQTSAATTETTEATMQTVSYFYGDDNAEHILSETAQIPQLTAQALMDLLSEKGVLPEPVTVRDFRQENGVLTLDLSQEFAQAAQSTGTAGEWILIGSVVNTFLTAYEAEQMYLRIDGGELATGHNVYDFALSFYQS